MVLDPGCPRLLRALPLRTLPLLGLGVIAAAQGAPPSQPAGDALFDGETLAGWETLESDEKWWGVLEGRLRGGSLDEDVPHNTFLATRASFQNFDLRLSIRLEGSGGLVNSGIQIRSTRVEQSSEMRGYQVDVGEGWWGKLYDESRRNRVIAEPVDPAALAAAVRPDGWNDYRILAEGARIRSWINGVPALDYTEVDGEVPLDGHIGIQVHSGGRVLVEVREISLEELPPTPGAMTWRLYEKAQSVSQQGTAPRRTAAQELAGFHVLEGFEVELVTSDPLIDKVVDVAFDDAGRMWAITAVEYPIDGNESEGVAELYARGGRDKVLVFDEPWKAGPHTPRVFADGMFIPMAILPRTGDVLVGMGPDILRLRDTDGDGRADAREVVLTGFGIQDSHLLPHRFVRAPGDWVYLAQGAFNSSRVETGEGDVVAFDKCKVGRFRTDGSRFEVVGIGLNNIWGFVIDRLGDKWIQEANDLGFPLVPFEHGRSYPGIGMDRFHPHSPWHPSYADFSMGGTGLSGLALSQDVGGFPAPWDDTFFVANPILSAVQSIRATREASAPSDVQLERARDLLTSDDENFRPVAIHFGPDGCLYIVDWYNPIISHNEVPRDHPDRDRTSSRIWRVRHESQERRAPRDVSAAKTSELPGLLRSASTWTARAAWHQIAERGAVELEQPLTELAADSSVPACDRVLALWSLQDIGRVSAELLELLARDPHHALRREAARLAGELELPSAELARSLDWATEELDPRVRRAALESLERTSRTGPEVTALLLRFLRPLPEGPTRRMQQGGVVGLTGVAGDIAFERSLVRAALEQHPEPLFALLASPSGQALEPATKRFTLLCAGDAEGARRLASLLVDGGGRPSSEELSFLARHADEHEVRSAIEAWINAPATRAEGLRMLADSRQRWQEDELAPAVVASLRALVAAEPGPASHELLLRLARERRLAQLEPDVVALYEEGHADPSACLGALVELGCDDAGLYFELANTSLPGTPGRRLAAGALAGIAGEEAFELLLELWPGLERTSRGAVRAALLEQEAGARRLVQAIDAGDIGVEVLDGSSVERLREHLGDEPLLTKLLERAAANQLQVLRFDGGGADYVDTDLVLEGAFTVEAWVRLDEGITNADGLLAVPKSFDLNFHDGRLRLWLSGQGDVIIAVRPVEPATWAHVALSRAEDGRLSLYVNGVLDVTTQPETPARFEGLDVGRTIPGVGSALQLSELRVWDRERTAVEIGAEYRRRLGPGSRPAGLRLVLPGDPATLSGAARLEGVFDPPPVLTDAELAQEALRFERYRGLAGATGDVARGREQFRLNCATCHIAGGAGASIGPVLDGVAAKGTEGILRSILTPNAGVESGYRTLIVRTFEGEILDGFLAAEDADSILLRRKDREDLRLARDEIESARFDSLSLMPEGLLDGLSDGQVTDLFEYLQSLE